MNRSACVIATLLGVADFVSAAEPATPVLATRFRRPVAAAVSEDGARLFIANRDSGSISTVAVDDWSVTAEIVVGERLSDIAALPGARTLLVTDERANQLIVVRSDSSRPIVLDRIDVPTAPVSVTASRRREGDQTASRRRQPAGSFTCVSVTSLWARAVTLFDAVESADAHVALKRRHVIELPFAPRMQCFLPGGERLIVADSFGGRLALIDAVAGTLVHVREFPGHNIRGLALSPDGGELYVAHQLQNPDAGTTYDSIHWGDLAENLIRVFPLAALLDPQADLLAAGRIIMVGTTGNGAGDPAAVLPLEDGRLVVLASGVDRAEIFPAEHSVITPWLETGRRPTQAAALPERERAVILNTLDDSLTVLDLATEEIAATVSLGPTREPGPVERGESLFFDARLSHDNWLSCHSCHTDGHSNGLLADTLSDGTLGTPKRVLSLLGTRDNNPWAWNGSMRTLHEQVRQSVSSSMQGLRPTPTEVIDLVAYLHTLEPPPGVAPHPTSASDAALLSRGRAVFDQQQCGRCHVPPLTYTSDQVVDVGLEDERRVTKFNPPSLRGVSQRERFFHDGRAASLEAVFEDYGHQLETGLSDEDLRALLRFLQSL